MINVISSDIHAIGYNEDLKTLRIKFRSGRIYEYFGVPMEDYKNLMNAQSKGKYFHRFIKHFKFKKII